jgi:hypothetical protein
MNANANGIEGLLPTGRKLDPIFTEPPFPLHEIICNERSVKRHAFSPYSLSSITPCSQIISNPQQAVVFSATSDRPNASM